MRSVPFIPVKGLVFCLVLALLTSCGTSTNMIYVSVINPPASGVNIGNAQDLCIVAPYYKDRDSVKDSIYTNNLLHELKHQLQETPNLQSAPIELRMIGLQNQEPDDSLINELYKECPSEAFIFIDVISRSLEFATISTYISGSDADIYATGKYCYVIAKNNEAEVQCDSLRGMLYFDFKRMDSIYTYIMARDIASNLNVYWLTDNRVYYSSGSKNMRRATKYADAYNWPEAMVLWQNDVNTKNAKLSAKAAFNMALACEMMGLFDVAIDWLKYAESRFPKLSLAKDYQIVLQQRKEQKNRVDDLLKK